MERIRTDRIPPGEGVYPLRDTTKQTGTFCLMVNAEAGRVRTEGAEKVVDDVSSCFDEMDIPLEVIITSSDTISRTLEKSLASKSFDSLLIAGGDGTINSAMKAVSGTDISLGILPYGTLNFFFHLLGFPSSLEETCQMLAANHTRLIRTADMNGIPFFLHSSIGLYPRMVARRKEYTYSSRREKIIATLTAAATVLRDAPHMKVRLEAADLQKKAVTPFVIAEINGFRFFFSESPPDPSGQQFRVHVGHPVNPGRLFYLACCDLLRIADLSEAMESFDTDSFDIHSRRKKVKVIVDGELVTTTPPITYSLRNEWVKVLAPPLEPA